MQTDVNLTQKCISLLTYARSSPRKAKSSQLIIILYLPNTSVASFPKENLGTRLERLLVSFQGYA